MKITMDSEMAQIQVILWAYAICPGFSFSSSITCHRAQIPEGDGQKPAEQGHARSAHSMNITMGSEMARMQVILLA